MPYFLTSKIRTQLLPLPKRKIASPPFCLNQLYIVVFCPPPSIPSEVQHQLSPRIVTHIPHKVFQLSSRDLVPSPKLAHLNHSTITCKSTNKAKNKKQVIEPSVSLKHNSFGISCHTTELGFLFSFIHKKCWILFLGHKACRKGGVIFIHTMHILFLYFL